MKVLGFGVWDLGFGVLSLRFRLCSGFGPRGYWAGQFPMLSLDP